MIINKYAIALQGNGIRTYSDYTDLQADPTFKIDPSTGNVDTQGNITAQDIYGNDIHFRSEDGEGYYSLGGFFANFRERLLALEDVNKTVFSDDLKFKRSDGVQISLRNEIEVIHTYINDLYSRTGGSS